MNDYNEIFSESTYKGNASIQNGVICVVLVMAEVGFPISNFTRLRLRLLLLLLLQFRVLASPTRENDVTVRLCVAETGLEGVQRRKPRLSTAVL